MIEPEATGSAYWNRRRGLRKGFQLKAYVPREMHNPHRLYMNLTYLTLSRHRTLLTSVGLAPRTRPADAHSFPYYKWAPTKPATLP